jgi:hypothetical protein
MNVNRFQQQAPQGRPQGFAQQGQQQVPQGRQQMPPQQPPPGRPQGFAPQGQQQRGFAPAPTAPGRMAGPPQHAGAAQRPAFRGGPAGPGQQRGFQQRGPAQAMNGNPFAGVGQARARRDANYITDGGYIVLVNKVKHIVGHRDRLNKVIVELTVLAVLAASETGRTHQIGEQAVHVIKEDLQYDYFLPEVKAMIAGIVECPEEAIDEAFVLECCNEQTNPLGGYVIEMANRPKMTGGGKLITIRNYKRRIRSGEIQQILAPDVVARFFPGDTLARMAQAEASEVQQDQQQQAQSFQQPAPQQQQQGYAQGYAQAQVPEGYYLAADGNVYAEEPSDDIPF